MVVPAPIERLIENLRRLPGIGEKSATRLAFYLLAAPQGFADELASAISRVKRDVVFCEICFDMSESSPCRLCQDRTRNPKQICVVEEPADRAAVEASGSFRGLYHVLGGTLAPIDGIGPEDLRIAELEARVRDKGAEEVVIATNPTAEGDATAHFLADRLRSTGVRLTRIASGMPLGGDLEYADRVTVGRSFDYRRDIE